MMGVVGLGLMGGSLALAARETGLFDTVVGYDHNPAHEKEAIDRKLVDGVLPYDRLCATADLLVMAVPVNVIKRLLTDGPAIRKDATIIDLGGTKADIVAAVPEKLRKNFVATHPMAGTEYSGPGAAFSSLFKGKIVVLCDTEESGADHVKRVETLYQAIGMEIVSMDAREHDRHAAFISHMPHMVSYSLANAVLAQEDKQNILTLAAGGFRDMSRLAKSSGRMWQDIFMQNKEQLLVSVECFQKELKHAKKLVENEKWEEVLEWMESANRLYDIFEPRK